MGVDAVRPGEDTDRATGTCTYCAAMSAAYPDPADWISATTKRLGTWGFNTLGAGSDYAMFGPSFAYVPQLDFDGSWQPGGQSGTTHDWFDPAFADHAADVVRAKVAPLAVDPYLMGWYPRRQAELGLGRERQYDAAGGVPRAPRRRAGAADGRAVPRRSAGLRPGRRPALLRGDDARGAPGRPAPSHPRVPRLAAVHPGRGGEGSRLLGGRLQRRRLPSDG
ncbi:hypothetical protein ACU686_16860 [Yinghuangia aomiensis]